MKLLLATVRAATTIGALYREHAGLRSIDAYLTDWRRAHARLGRQIDQLQALRDERHYQIIKGEWPPPKDTTT